MKKYIFFTSALLLTASLAHSMEDAALAAANAVSAKEGSPFDPQPEAPERPKHLVEADTLVTILERTYQAGKSGSGLLPAKGVLDSHKGAINDPEAVLQLSDKEREDLVKWYQVIYLHLSRMTPAQAKEHPLRNYKKRIYAAALKLFTSKQAAKQWLKAADCYTDEETELDAFNPHAESQGYSRSNYTAAKRSLTIQQQRLEETKNLEGVVAQLKKDGQTIDQQIGALNQRLAALLEQKTQNTETQQKVTNDMQATNRTLKTTGIIYTEKLAILETMLKEHTEKIKTTVQEIETLRAQAPNKEQKKVVEEADVKPLLKTVEQLKTDRAAIRRDIDLLTKDYTFWKKFAWKLSGFLTSYPIEEEATPKKDAPKVVQEDEKDN